MIPNFEDVKKQLGELAAIVNEFKSEQVQLRVIEALLASIGVVPSATPPQKRTEREAANAKPRPRRRPKADGNGEGGTPRSSSKKGPKAAIVALLGSDYFAQKRTAGEVQAELRTKKAMNLSLSTVQTTLNRLLENEEIKRERDAETKQFRYWK